MRKPILWLFIWVLAGGVCVAQGNVNGLKVNIEADGNEKSLIKVNFINKSDSDLFLSKYLFCEGGVIFQDLFIVAKNGDSKYDKAYNDPIISIAVSTILA